MATLSHSQILIRVRENLPIVWQTKLSSGVTSGTNVFLPTEGVQGPATAYAIVGYTGTPSNELQTISGSLTSSGFTVTTLTDSYDQGVPIKLTDFNMVKIVSGSTIDGTFSGGVSGAITSLGNPDGIKLSSLTIDNTQYYKVIYGNASGYQDASDVEPFQLTTLGELQDYCTTEDVLIEAGLDQYGIESKVVNRYISTASSIVDAALARQNVTVPMSNPPGYVRYATQLIAAGYLLNKEYGAEAEGTTKDGTTKIQTGMDLVYQIASGILAPNVGDGGNDDGVVRYYPTVDETRMFDIDTKF